MITLNTLNKMEKIVFASNNEHKIRELSEILKDKFEILSLKDIDCQEDIPETAATIEGNSMQKANYVYNKYNIDCIADDTGLEIEALNGRPGVYSARYAGEEKNMNKNIEKIMNELADKKNRKAQFKTVISLILKGKKYQFEGIVKGKILNKKQGKGGFGYDPVFMPEGYDISFAEMKAEEKNRISHRGRAVQKLLEFLNRENLIEDVLKGIEKSEKQKN